MKLLQVCNVGEICGGTAACAWTITHAFPDAEHSLMFVSQPSPSTRDAFQHCRIATSDHVSDQHVRQIQPDFVILHNTSPTRVESIHSAVCLQYHHSVGQRTGAHRHVACSNWLLEQCPQADALLYQPVPLAPQINLNNRRSLEPDLRIGRICTPTTRKWPTELLRFYVALAAEFPHVIWEFVGVPKPLQNGFTAACRGRCNFHDAGFEARQHLWNWHALLYHHPTLTESFGRITAEAMRTGTVPIVDARGGFLEQIEQGTSGFLCREFSQFASAIDTLLDRSEWLRMSQASRAQSNRRFSLRTFRDQLLNQLASVS